MDKRTKKTRGLKNKMTDAYTGKIINQGKEVIAVENAIPFIRKMGYLVSNFKLLLFICMFALLVIPSASAFDFDNRVVYSDDDMTATLKNAFDLPLFGVELGSLTLKSHDNITHIKKVGLGDQITMYYDFNYKELYKNGLGAVNFYDLNNDNKKVYRDYSYVIWVSEERERTVFGSKCISSYVNGTCIEYQTIKEKYIFEGWEDYNSIDIPKGEIRIGIRTEVLEDDYVDGIWTISGQEIAKHASWVGIASFSHGHSITTGAGQTGGYGVQFKYTGEYDEFIVSSVTAVSGAGCDSARIDYVSNGTFIAFSDTFDSATGGTANFYQNYTLHKNVLYGISCVTPSGDRKYANPFGSPVVTGDVTWENGWGTAGGLEANYWNIGSTSAVDTSWNNIESIYLSRPIYDLPPIISTVLPANNTLIESCSNPTVYFNGTVSDDLNLINV